jgi:hypothetical protein
MPAMGADAPTMLEHRRVDRHDSTAREVTRQPRALERRLPAHRPDGVLAPSGSALRDCRGAAGAWTKKVLDRLGGATAGDADRSTTQLGYRYANVLFLKAQLALFVNEATMLPVVVPFAPAATLLDRFPPTLQAHFQAHGVPRRFT